jgi:hypothetical protein
MGQTCSAECIDTNTRALSSFRYHVLDLWRRALRRRSQRDRTTWKSMGKLADRWLPAPRISHPWPSQRFRVKHPRWEPYAGKSTYGSVRRAPGDGRPDRDPGGQFFSSGLEGRGLARTEYSGQTLRDRLFEF